MSEPTENTATPADPAPPVWLSDADALALDAILEARAVGHDPGATPLPPGSAERAQSVMALLSLFEQDPVESAPNDLTQRTMERVRTYRQRQRFAQQAHMLSEPRRSLGFSVPRFLMTAALFLIGMSLLMPVLERTRADARRIACAGQLGVAGEAIGRYAAANAGVMPRGPVVPESIWWNVGQAHQVGQPLDQPVHSNSAHLYLLVRQGYLTPADLACPCNAHARPARMTPEHHDWPALKAVSYSYQNQYTPRPIRLNRDPRLAVLADKNPLFIVRVGQVGFNTHMPCTSPSRSHDSRGQNILTADGAVAWTVRPMVSRYGDGDNIWVLPGVRHYTGRETPSNGHGRIDSFLVP